MRPIRTPDLRLCPVHRFDNVSRRGALTVRLRRDREKFPPVLEDSAKGPVLADYWSPHAGPCMILMPHLLRLAVKFRGPLLLAMLKSDELARLAGD